MNDYKQTTDLREAAAEVLEKMGDAIPSPDRRVLAAFVNGSVREAQPVECMICDWKGRSSSRAVPSMSSMRSEGEFQMSQEKTTNLCDCELSHNGMGIMGRECDCPAGNNAMKDQPKTTEAWVLAYILRFPGEEGEWAQAHRRAFSTEAMAQNFLTQIKAEPGSYQVCRVVVENAP